MLKVAALVSGGGTNLQAIMDRIKSGAVTNTEITAVISSSKHAYALERADKQGIQTACVIPSEYPDREAFYQALLKKLNELKPDLIVLAGYLVVLPRQIVEAYPNKIINVHPSLIPAFCGKGFYGLKVHEAALERGVKITGATVHFVDEGTDTGPIILQKPVCVEADDTPESLQKRVMEEAEWSILPEAINRIANNAWG